MPHADISMVANNSGSWFNSDKKVDRDRDGVDVFGPGGGNAVALPAIDVKSLHAKIGELTLENDS